MIFYAQIERRGFRTASVESRRPIVSDLIGSCIQTGPSPGLLAAWKISRVAPIFGQMSLPRVQPIAPTRRKEPFDHPEWVFDVKYHGFRAVCYLHRGDAILCRDEAMCSPVSMP
jgi:hypothetical protein